MHTRTATRTAERTEFLADILATAVEHCGYGWFSIEAYEPDEGYAVVISDGEDQQTYGISLDTISRGVGVILRAVERDDGVLVDASRHRRIYVSHTLRDRIRKASSTNDASELDVVDALAVLECALFGHVHYS